MKRIVSLLLICVMCIHLYPCTVKASTESNLIKYDIDAMHDQAMDYYKRYASEHTEHLDFALISVAAAVYKYQAVFVYPIECVDGIKYEMVMCFSTDQDMTYTCSEGSAHVTGFLQCRFIFEKDDYSSFQYTYCLAPTTAYFSLTKKLPIEALKKYNNFKLTYNNDVDKTYEYRAPANLFNTMTQAVLESSYFKLDSDHDGLPDVMEINGIAVSDDERITTNPFDKHSDKDGLTDGEELVLAPVDQKTPVTPINYKVTKISDPTKEDTDGDGLDDMKEVRGFKFESLNGEIKLFKGDPLHKGIAGGYCGELTIVSCTNKPFGHAFLVYQSFIDDILDFRGFTKGYNYTTWSPSQPRLYEIKPFEYVALGNAGNNATASSSHSQLSEFESTGVDNDDAGVFFNREFAVEVQMDNKNKEFEHNYDQNYALSKLVDKSEINIVVEWLSKNNWYNLRNHNCAHTAVGAWNSICGEEYFTIKKVLDDSILDLADYAKILLVPSIGIRDGVDKIIYEASPAYLKDQISNYPDSFVFNMDKVLDKELH